MYSYIMQERHSVLWPQESGFDINYIGRSVEFVILKKLRVNFAVKNISKLCYSLSDHLVWGTQNTVTYNTNHDDMA